MTINSLNKFINGLSINLIDFYSQKKNGHVVFKHVGVANESLRKRAMHEKIKAAASFYDEFTALDAIKKTLLEYAPDLVDWINSYSDFEDMEAYFEFDIPIGYAYSTENWHNWDDGPVPVSATKVCLIKTGREDVPFLFRTAFPFICEADKVSYLSKKESA